MLVLLIVYDGLQASITWELSSLLCFVQRKFIVDFFPFLFNFSSLVFSPSVAADLFCLPGLIDFCFFSKCARALLHFLDPDKFRSKDDFVHNYKNLSSFNENEVHYTVVFAFSSQLAHTNAHIFLHLVNLSFYGFL